MDTIKTAKSFSFGKNWQSYLNSLDDAKIANAISSLKDFLGMDTLKGKSFLDIGCGSGIFSLSALKLNADRIASFDVDQFSVEGCKLLRKKENDPANWKIYQGSILDTAFVGQLGKFDIVYSWGVLHHTGDMWNAIKNAADLVAPGGFFYIALYNKVEGRRGSAFWLNRKRLYNRLPLTGKKVLEWNHILSFFLKALFRGKSPFRVIRNYDSLRGMSWRHDITDWVGGFPYECATIEEVFIFMKTHFPEFTLKNIKSTNSLGNNSFLFKYNA